MNNVGTQTVRLEDVAVSKTNPRKHFDKEQLAELTASVKKHGVLQPVLVRPIAGGYELVAGERRYRAAKAAGLAEIPAFVRELTDAAALEVQVIENLQRADLHPLEEAEGYEQLQKLHGYTVDDLAAKIGKSKAYVYGRLKLTALVPAARKALFAGKLTPSTALLVARIPVDELQLEALKELTPRWDNEPVSFQRAAQVIQERFMLRLADAPFKTDDADLVPAAGPCTTCPKRTGNQRELFADVKGPDLCTDPKCFDQKREVAWGWTKREAEGKGTRVIDGAAAKKLYPHGGNSLSGSEFVDLSYSNYDDAKMRTWGQILGKSAEPHVVLVRDDRGGVHRLLPRAQLAGLLKAAGYKAPPSRGGNIDQYAAKAKAQRAKAMLDAKVRGRALEEIRKRLVVPLLPASLVLVAESFFAEMHHEARKGLFGIIGLEAKKQSGMGYDLQGPFRKHVEGLGADELGRLLVVMTVSPRDYWQGKDRFPELAKQCGLDLTKIRKQVVADQPKKKAPKKAKGGKRAA